MKKQNKKGKLSKFQKYNKKKSISSFTRNLLLFVGVFLVFMVVCLFRLWNYLVDYQNSLPSILGDEILTAYKTCNTPLLRQYVTDLPEAFQDDFVYSQYLYQYLDRNSLYYYETSSGEGNEITYLYLTDNGKFATLTVTKTGEESKYGFPLYEISSLEQYSQASYTLYQAAGTTILLDGEPIDDSYIISEEEVGAAFLEAELGPFTNITYEIPDTAIASDITAIDNTGSPVSVNWKENHTSCQTEYFISDALTEELTDFATSACKAYAVFATVKNASSETLRSYLYPDSAFLQIIRSYDNSWGIDKTSDSFDEVICSAPIAYSDSAFICNVSLQYTVTQNSQGKTYPLSFTCNILKKDGKLYLLSLNVE